MIQKPSYWIRSSLAYLPTPLCDGTNGLLQEMKGGGQVDVFDLRQNPSPLVSSADLRQLTGHTGSEDIEIRALWADDLDNLIFAGSSWGND